MLFVYTFILIFFTQNIIIKIQTPIWITANKIFLMQKICKMRDFFVFFMCVDFHTFEGIAPEIFWRVFCRNRFFNDSSIFLENFHQNCMFQWLLWRKSVPSFENSYIIFSFESECPLKLPSNLLPCIFSKSPKREPLRLLTQNQKKIKMQRIQLLLADIKNKNEKLCFYAYFRLLTLCLWKIYVEFFSA